MALNLSVVRGEYRSKDRPLERGIGTIAFAEARDAKFGLTPLI